MKKWWLISVFLLLLACGKDSHEVKASFYYWKTNFLLNEAEQQVLDSLKVEKLYIRYFDVALKGDMAIPVMPILFEKDIPRQEIVPVIYIKNEVMLNQKVNLNDLADKVLDYIHQINKKNNITIREIQLDCDWSLDSKDRFFSLLNFLEQKEDVLFSSTIRLHQVKYHQKTGVPNVDRGVLMYYNMGIIATDSLNSIYDRKIAHTYITSLSHYPLHLDIALPIYSWIVHSRQNKIIRLISRVRRQDIEQQKAFRKIDNTRFEVMVSGNYFGQYFKKEDQIKLESISAKELQEMISDLEEHLADPPNEIIFYDLDASNINAYEKDEFKKLVNSF